MNGTPHTLVQIPSGVQCFVGPEARRRRAIEDLVLSVFEGWDYEEIIPPLYDYADVFAGPALGPKTYSFLGRDGSLLALRPDFTSLLAKIAAGRLRDRPAPIRLYYSGEVLRYEPPQAGRQSELYQMGLEQLGGVGPAADAEVVAIAAECLDRLGLSGWVIALGHVGAFAAVLSGCGLEAGALEALRDRVESKDRDGVRETCARHGVPPEAASAIALLAGLGGDPAALDEAEAALARWPSAQGAVRELRAVVDALKQAGLAPSLAVDLGEVRGLDYYTGMVFRVYAPGLGFEVGGGGRYDGLLARFGRPMPAVGFMLGLDRVATALGRQGAAAGTAGPEAESIRDAALGTALARARERRQAGGRIRFAANGGPEPAAGSGR
jgi:ATP phosphoribosyltransferase regulatory subunit